MQQRYFSQVYWHFTGSPDGIDWSTIKSPEEILAHGKPKDDQHATDIALAILDSHTLKATSVERIASNLTTEPFCCVTDVPLKDLVYHGQYYGHVAIGFRARAVQSNFLPVLYIPRDRLPDVKEVTEPDGQLVVIASELLASTGGWGQAQGDRLMRQAYARAVTRTVADTERMQGLFPNLLKITDFSPRPGGSFYSEREWRHFGNFRFEPEDVEAVLVPEAELPRVQAKLQQPPYQGHEINLLSWEFLSRA